MQYDKNIERYENYDVLGEQMEANSITTHTGINSGGKDAPECTAELYQRDAMAESLRNEAETTSRAYGSWQNIYCHFVNSPSGKMKVSGKE